MCALAPRQEEPSSLMVGLGQAEGILTIIILCPPISWDKAKLTLLNPAKFGAQMLQPGGLNLAGPQSSPAGKFCQHWGSL